MKFGAMTAGERRTIDVRRSRDGWTAVVGDRRLAVHVARAGSRWSLLLGPDGERPTQSHEVALEWSAPGAWVVVVGGRRVTVTLEDAGAARARQPARTAAGSVTVVTPMPGRVVTVLVSPGQAVAARQGLVVVEAMKMENEVPAPIAGTVIEVPVTEGMAVTAGAVLAVIEPNAEREP
jgi:biotin carboxyl carrier protein